ncbi:MAG TPA: hypothetical protein VJN39_06655, partial [Gemmatimonadales bacterium]|nr:hypothetical protein [Gemmatimonadales bacterium]
MALKDRLLARKQGEGRPLDTTERGLSLLEGTRSAPEPAIEVAPATKQAGISPALAAAKSAIHAQLVERHADELDITDRAAVRSRIEEVADEHIKSAGSALNRLDYGYLVDALLDEVLGLGPLQSLLDDPAITEIMINNPDQIYVER